MSRVTQRLFVPQAAAAGIKTKAGIYMFKIKCQNRGKSMAAAGKDRKHLMSLPSGETIKAAEVKRLS